MSNYDFETPHDAGSNNVYNIDVDVLSSYESSPGSPETDMKDVAITVTNVVETIPPSITSGDTALFEENGTGVAYTATASEAYAGDVIIFALGGTDAGLFNINSVTGAVTFKVAPDFEAPTDSGKDHVYNFTVTASDSYASSAAKAVAITVEDVPEYYVKQGNGLAHYVTADDYHGEWASLKWTGRQFPTAGGQAQDMSGNDIVIGTILGDLINGGAGNDAIDGGAGSDVLDGGTGSNFITGGTGTDEFFIDGRAASTSTTWSTITDFQAGEHVTIWGYQPGVSKFTWVASDGTAGYKGATLHCDLNGNGTTDTSVTFAGLTQAQLPVQSYGVVGGVDYVFIG